MQSQTDQEPESQSPGESPDVGTSAPSRATVLLIFTSAILLGVTVPILVGRWTKPEYKREIVRPPGRVVPKHSEVTIVELNIPHGVDGGAAVKGVVRLARTAPAGGALVKLRCDQKCAQVPSSVTVPSGDTRTTFDVKTTRVPRPTRTAVTASYEGASITALLMVNKSRQTPKPEDLYVQAVNLPAQRVVGGKALSANVEVSKLILNGNAVVSLRSDSKDVTVPKQVTVEKSDRFAPFKVQTKRVSKPLEAVITASYKDREVGVPLTLVTPGSETGLVDLILEPTTVEGGRSVEAVISLSRPAPAGGLAVALESRQGVAQLPKSVSVPAGETSAGFRFGTSTVPRPAAVVVTAMCDGVLKDASLVVKPAHSSEQRH